MIDALRGLLGGLGGGLNAFIDNRQQQLENDNKNRQILVQEQEAKRLQQAQEWEESKAAYEALTGEYDPNDATIQPMIGKLPFVKNPNGTLSRPMNQQEQHVDLQNKLLRLNDNGRKYFMENPQALEDYGAAQRIMLSFGFKPTDAPKTLQQIQAEANAEYAPRAADAALDRATQERIAAGRNATDVYQADKMYDSRQAMLNGQMDRLEFSALNRPINEDDYQMWLRTEFLPNNREMYNQMLGKVDGQKLDSWVREAYLQARNPMLKK